MLYIKKLNYEDTEEEYNFLSSVPYLEKGYRNVFNNIPKEKFREECLDILINLSYLTEPKGTILPMTTYFLWLDEKIIGIYHVIHELNEYQKERDGHISYAVLKDYRGQGYASKGLSLVLEESKKIVKESAVYMHTTKDNQASLKVMLNNGAYIAKETETDYFTRIKIK